jgi:hypothetical protein
VEALYTKQRIAAHREEQDELHHFRELVSDDGWQSLANLEVEVAYCQSMMVKIHNNRKQKNLRACLGF